MSFIAKNPLSLPEIDYTPSTPLKGTRGLYPKEDGWYDIDDNGNEKKILDSDDKNDIDRVGQKTENNGEIFNDYDNNIASANNSHAEGYKSEAQNDCAHAENNATIASGYGSHSEGNNTHASGNYSHVEGTRSVAKGEASHAEGLRTIASSNNSHAQGENTKAGTKGFKIASSFTNDGSGTIKFNLNSSEGLNDNLIGTPCTLRVANEFSNGITISGYDTTANTITLKGVPADATYETDSDDASTHTVENFIVIQGHPELGDTDVGHNAHAGGYNTLAQGRETFAAGRDNKVVGQYGAVTGRENIVGHGAFASGRKNTALGTMSHAEGSETKAIGSCAHAEGKNTESYGTYSHAEGSYTKAHGDFTHSEGYRSTASGEASHAEGGDTTAEGNYSHAEGYSSYAKGINTHSEGNNTYAEGSASHAEGTDSQSVGQSSHAEGRGTLANGTNSHSEGNSTEARGNHSHAEGVKSRTGNTDNTGGYAAHAEGNETEATGSSSHSEGNQTHATASCSHAEGNNTYATGSASHAEGAYTIAASAYQHVQGKYNIVDSEGTYAHIIGNGTGNADDQRKNIHTVDWDGNAWFAGEITVGEDKDVLAKQESLERLQYYGDSDILITPEDYYFCDITEDGAVSIYEGIHGTSEYPNMDLTQLVVPYKIGSTYVSSIDDNAFSYCGALTTITLPNSIIHIGNKAFFNCSKLTSIDIPNTTSIGTLAFAHCVNLTSVTIPDSVTSIGARAFMNCPNLTIICSQGSYADTYAKENGIKVKYDVIDADSLNNSSGGTGAVSSVNGKVGDVVLKAEDIGAYSREETDSKLSTVYKYKGTIDYYFQLPSNPEIGDVYNIRYASGEEYIEYVKWFPWSISVTLDNDTFIQVEYNPFEIKEGDALTLYFYGDGLPDPLVTLKVDATIFENSYEEGKAYLYESVLLIPILDEKIISTLNNNKPKLRINNFNVVEPSGDNILLNSGDNVAWTGTEWDILGGTEDMSLYAQTDLSNVDNATFKAKAESAGVGGGSIDLSDCEKISNKTTEINADSTDDQYPSAKAVWDVTKNAGGATTSFSSIILNSSTEGSTKQFKITIDDNGKLTARAVEVNE